VVIIGKKAYDVKAKHREAAILVEQHSFGFQCGAQYVQIVVRFSGHTFQVPLRVRSGRPGNSLRSNISGRFLRCTQVALKMYGQWCPGP
jgi:hypothetical protein